MIVNRQNNKNRSINLCRKGPLSGRITMQIFMIPQQLASHNAICKNDWRGWELFKTWNGNNLSWLWTVGDGGILSYRTSVHVGRYWPCNGQNGNFQNESAADIFPYILWYMLALLAQKKPQQILLSCSFFVLFCFFTKVLHIVIYVFGFHKADTCT